MKGFESTLGQPRVIRGGDGSNGVLKETQFLGNFRMVGGENESTHDDVRVAVDVFRDAVVYDVGALEEGGGVEGREEGIVYKHEGFGGMGFGKTDDSRDIYQTEGGVCGRLDPHKLGIRLESG